MTDLQLTEIPKIPAIANVTIGSLAWA